MNRNVRRVDTYPLQQHARVASVPFFRARFRTPSLHCVRTPRCLATDCLRPSAARARCLECRDVTRASEVEGRASQPLKTSVIVAVVCMMLLR